jgi:hypothetical protein
MEGEVMKEETIVLDKEHNERIEAAFKEWLESIGVKPEESKIDRIKEV